MKLTVAARAHLEFPPDPTSAQVELRRALQKLFTHVNPAREAARKLNLYRLPPPTLQTWTWDQATRTLSFPRGKLSTVRALIDERGEDCVLADRRSTGWESIGKPPSQLKVTLRPYQVDGLRKMMTRQNCLLRACTGSGKTCLAFGLISAAQVPALVMVHTDALLKQWLRRCETELGMRIEDVGIVGAGARKLGPVTLAMQQTLASDDAWCREHADAFGLFLHDEVQGAPAETARTALENFSAKYRFGISADHSRPDGLECITEDCYGGIAAEYTYDELIEAGAILPVPIRVVPTPVLKPRFMFGQDPRRFTKLASYLAEHPARNQIIIDLVHQEVCAGQQVLAWCGRVEQCRAIDRRLTLEGVKTGLMIGGAKQQSQFEDAIEGMADGKLRAAVGTVQAVGQAIDLPTLSRGIIAVPLASNNRQQIAQCCGRLSRLGSKDALCFYLLDWSVYGKRHLINLDAWFPGRVFVLDGSDEWLTPKEWLRRHKGSMRDTREVDDQLREEGIFE